LIGIEISLGKLNYKHTVWKIWGSRGREMEEAGTSETSMPTYKSAWRHVTQHRNLWM
jgi:hypothetical protein